VQLLVLGEQDEPDSAYYLSQLESSAAHVVTVNHMPDVRSYMALSTVVVLPTRREGMPNVVLEAAAMALPVITTMATGAVDSVVHEETGLLVPVDDPHALALAIARLLRDPELCYEFGRRGRQRVVTLFQPTDVARAIVAIARGARTPVRSGH